MQRVFVAGAGFTPVADHWGKSLSDLARDASRIALKGTGSVKPEYVIVGNVLSGISSRQEQLGALVADSLGLGGVPAFKVESGHASGSMGLRMAYAAIAGGGSDAILLVGVEKVRDLEQEEAPQAMSVAESAEYTQFFGVSSTAMSALLCRLYLHTWDIARDYLSSFAVIAHNNASTAPHAQFRKRVTVDDVARSQVVCDPLRLLDCSPMGDGAAAILLVSERKLPELSSKPTEIVGSGAATAIFNAYERDDMLDFSATTKALQDALSQSGASLRDIDFMEIHDQYCITAALSLEAMGFSRRGEAPIDASKGKYSIHGPFPISTFGGLKARGAPMGATGVYQAAEAHMQLSDAAAENQVKDCSLGLTHCMGGLDSSAVVHIFKRFSG